MQARRKIDTPLLNYTQTTEISKGHGLFERQYICVITDKRADCMHDLWNELKEDARALKKEGVITEQKRADIFAIGRDLVDDHAFDLAHELNRYGLLELYLK